MRDTLIIIGFAFAAVVVGAALYFFVPRGAPPSTSVAEPVGAMVPLTVLSSGAQSSVTSRANYLISSSAELRALWQMLSTSDPMPSVDFSTQEVIALFAGTEPSEGYTISASAVTDSATERLVRVTIAAPGVSCLATQTKTAPYQVLVLPKSALALAHEDSATITSCLR